VNFKDSFNNCSKTLSFPSKSRIPHLMIKLGMGGLMSWIIMTILVLN
jgi:hypothetical protein